MASKKPTTTSTGGSLNPVTIGKVKKPKPARKTTATIPAWTCPKCGATHPITVDACCKPAATFPPFVPVPRNPYGFCPQCRAPGANRERRINGNDVCANGHIYPSKNARNTP